MRDLAAIDAGVHTHFASGTHMLATLLELAIGVTFWRLAWLHAAKSSNPTVQKLAGAALFQL